ncbi:MAG: hypothetical protein ACLQU1_08600 [Bryobacteraceae bacterium]
MGKPNDLNTRPRSAPAKSGGWFVQGWGAVPLIITESQFQDLRDYLSLARDFVIREQQTFLKRVEDAIAANSLQGEDKDEYYGAHEEEYDQLHSRFPRLAFSSTFLMACSLFESSLVDLCKGFERESALSTPRLWSDFPNDKGRMRAAEFLKANFGIHLSNYAHWDEITVVFKVRDCIVHADGDVSNMQPKHAAQVKVSVKAYSHLDLNITHGSLVIGSAFVSYVIEVLAGLWPNLHTACFENEVLGPHYWP